MACRVCSAVTSSVMVPRAWARAARGVPQDGGDDDVPDCPGQLVARPLQGEQPGAGNLSCQRKRVAVREEGILGAVNHERRSAYLSESFPPAIAVINDGEAARELIRAMD